MTQETNDGKPLKGLKVLELGHFIAAPFCTRLLADLGAEVIKVEPPNEGDPARGWGLQSEGQSIWWSLHARGKTCITLDLKQSEGQEIALKLIGEVDAIVENFRPGQLERWGLGFDEIKQVNPACILVRISGYGQDGPYKDKVSFGVIGEAMGGLRHLTAFPKGITDLPPARTGVSLGDSLAALYGAFGLMSAVYERQKTGLGKVVDVALYESVFSLLEGCLPEYSKLGAIREPTGSTLPTNAPSNAYPTKDDKWLIIAGNSDRIFVRLMEVIGRADLGKDSTLSSNQGRVANAKMLDEVISNWSKQLKAKEAHALLDAKEIPATIIYTIEDIANDPHYIARGMVTEVHDEKLGTFLHPGVVPRFDSVMAKPPKTGAKLGEDNAKVFKALGLTEAMISELKQRKVI